MKHVVFRCSLLLGALMGLRAQNPPERAGAVRTGEVRLIEVAGRVDFQEVGHTNWLAATNQLSLQPGDRLRTRPQSRAAVQFSDRSVLRLSEGTTLEIQPPRQAEKKRFRLLDGVLFFFNREKPSDVEFETPVVSGAIRGTEFVLAANAAAGTSRLSLLDGVVDLTAEQTQLSLRSGEEAEIERGRAPVRRPLLEAARVLQWALYYPAVVYPQDVAISSETDPALAAVLSAYLAGDLLVAQAALASIPTGSREREQFRAALELSVGGVAAAATLLETTGADSAVARAVREIITVVRGDPATVTEETTPATASEWLARSYTRQAQFRLPEARAAARVAAQLAPDFGFAHVRVSEMEFAMGDLTAALSALDRALVRSPRLAQAYAVQGFVQLDRGEIGSALMGFDRALALDAALGNAWLGRGLALFRLHRREEAVQSLQTAAALEPRRGLVRAYLGKAYAAVGETNLAEKDFRLGKELDPNDPTVWLYAALSRWQQLRPNTAVAELQRSAELNDNRQLFRSRLLLERDRAVRSANLAAVYEEAGLPEVGRRASARAVAEDYGNFSGHLFVADSYQALEDPSRFNLRYETTRLSELLVANLLAPADGGNLSQFLSQQEHLQYFDPRPIGASSVTEYRSTGDWRQFASFYGSVEHSAYALDLAYESQAAQGLNAWREHREASLQLKHQLDAQDELYFQVGVSDGSNGDLARHFDSAEAHPSLRVTEEQLPNVFLGYHRTWSPAHQSLLLFSRLTDSLTLQDQGLRELFLRPNVTQANRVSTPGDFDLQYTSEFSVYSAELQHLWQVERNTLVVGTRWQTGTVQSDATVQRLLTGVVAQDSIDEPLYRAGGYVYDFYQIARPLRLVAGFSYDHLTHPQNSESPPLSPGRQTESLLAPKVGFLLTAWRDGVLRGAYTKSLGGLFFDNSVRLEPTQIAGFNQAFRSLLPESSGGIVPGTEFSTISLGFDQTLPSGTYLGVEADRLRSDGERTIGVFASPLPAPPAGSGSGTLQALEFHEHNFSAYAVQLLGEGFSVGARYHWREAAFNARFPQIPATAIGLTAVESTEASRLHEVGLSLNYQHAGGLFAGWESVWRDQRNSGYVPARVVDGFWMHSVSVGYRFPGRRAELRVGLVNLAGGERHLNPLSFDESLPSGRVAVVRLKLNF